MITGCDQSVLAVQELQQKENVKVFVGSALLWMYKKGLPTSTEISNESTNESRRLREPLKMLLGGRGLLQASRRRSTLLLSSIYERLSLPTNFLAAKLSTLGITSLVRNSSCRGRCARVGGELLDSPFLNRFFMLGFRHSNTAS